jgi:hypothetical protein
VSVLAFPRLYLKGEMSWDPSVANNDPATYDIAAARALFQDGEDADGFRARMIRDTVQRGDWNYFGGHGCALQGTTVVGGTSDPGPTDTTADPIVGAPVRLIGKLVDIDPYGTVSQVFFDELLVGVPGRPHLRARPRRRMVSRWLTRTRNRGPADVAIAGRAAAAWQAVFRAEDIELVRAEGSPLLSAVAAALEQEDTPGLMLRLSTYNTRYFTRFAGPEGVPHAGIDAATGVLAARHAAGEIVANPAYSNVIGTLGLWRAGDSEAAVSGRHLLPTAPPPPPQVSPALAAPVSAEFHAGAGILSLDLSHAVPEIAADLTKADLGKITVSVTRGATTTELGSIAPAAYARPAYEARGGIVDMSVTGPGVAELIRDGMLGLRVGEAAAVVDRQLIAQERELVAHCDDACLYLEDGETRQVAVTVRERGSVPTASLSLTVAAYGAPPGVVVRDPLPVPANGTVAVPVGGGGRVVEHLGLTVAPTSSTVSVPESLSLGTAQFLSVRTLPADDDLAAVPDADLTWELVYEKVLRHYHAVTPRMSAIIDLSDRDSVRTFAARILEVTDIDAGPDRNSASFESARYMPVTRDLSANRRQLLRRYCTKVLAEPLPPGPPERITAALTQEVAFASSERPASDIDVSFPKTGRG